MLLKGRRIKRPWLKPESCSPLFSLSFVKGTVVSSAYLYILFRKPRREGEREKEWSETGRGRGRERGACEGLEQDGNTADMLNMSLESLLMHPRHGVRTVPCNATSPAIIDSLRSVWPFLFFTKEHFQRTAFTEDVFNSLDSVKARHYRILLYKLQFINFALLQKYRRMISKIDLIKSKL